MRVSDWLLSSDSEQLVHNGVQTVRQEDSVETSHMHRNKVPRTCLEEELEPRGTGLWGGGLITRLWGGEEGVNNQAVGRGT